MKIIYIFYLVFCFTTINLLNKPVFYDKINQAGTILSNNTNQFEQNDSIHWQINFTNEGEIINNNIEFHCEIFINQNFKKNFTASSDQINAVLNKYRAKLQANDVLRLVLINTESAPLFIQSNNEFYSTKDQEIFLFFRPLYTNKYNIELSGVSSQVVDFHFFYIEKSNGIRNLWDVQKRIEPLIENEKPYLVYFHGPANQAIIIDYNSDKDDVDDFFNDLYTTITQPPYNPIDELERVSRTIQHYTSNINHPIRLEMFLYFNIYSYSFLEDRFINPLINNRIPTFDLVEHKAYIMTDFDVSNQNKAYNYINITNI